MTTPLKLGFGCSGAWGMRWFSEKKAVSLIHKAIDLGILEFDTAGFYCNGNAEKRLGLALQQVPPGRRSNVRVTSKTGTQRDTHGRLTKDFSERTIIKDVETSLRHLRIEALDALYLHGPDDPSLEKSLPVLVRLREKGLVKAIGVCGQAEGLSTAATAPSVDVLMGVYNLFKRGHDEIFATAKSSGKRIVAIAPLAQGLYRRRFLLPKSFADIWYVLRAAIKNQPELQQAQAARWLHQQKDWTASELALAFTLSSPNVDLALTTTTRSSHLLENAAAATRTLPAELRHRLLALAAES